MGRIKDITGQRFGKLTVLERAPRQEKRQSAWYCICDCGTKCIKRGTSLRFGWVKSCGCMSGLAESPKYIESIINWVFRICKGGATSRSLKFALTKSAFLSIIQKPCHYCGSEGRDLGAVWYAEKIRRIEKRQTSKADFRAESVKFIANGVDRIDSSKGYTKENCVPCCTLCNMMKKELTLEEFLSHIERISEFNRVKRK